MPKGKSLREWIDIYEKKTEDKFGVPEGFRLIYLAERGFAQYKLDINGKLIMVAQLCGDAKFWKDFLEMTYAHVGFDAIGTLCTRHIKPYIRGFGWDILTEQVKDGQQRFLCQDSIGRKVVATEYGKNEKGEPQFLVVQYFKEKAVTSLDE